MKKKAGAGGNPALPLMFEPSMLDGRLEELDRLTGQTWTLRIAGDHFILFRSGGSLHCPVYAIDNLFTSQIEDVVETLIDAANLALISRGLHDEMDNP